MSRNETERQLRWLMILRVVTVSTLLISAFAIELLLKAGQTLRPLFLLSAGVYGMVLVYAALDRWLSGSRAFIYVQLAGDAAVVTAFVGITGGINSPLSFLYLLPIVVASVLRYRQGALALAAVCWGLYATLVLQGNAWLPTGVLVHSGSERDAWRVSYLLLAHAMAFIAVALLASYLSERLRVQGHELQERRGAVARLQALNENIIESLNSGLITTDLAGRVNFMNRGGAEITGVTQDAVEGIPIETLFGLESGFLPGARAQLSAQRRFRFERHFSAADGRTIYLGIAVSGLKDRAGAPLGYIFIFQDLTEIHALEREVRLKERMAALGEMAAGMAHELRNPLAAISGAVQFMKGEIRPSGETLDLMDIILRESQRLDQAIRDFLTFARPGTFAPRRSDLVRLLEDNLKLLKKSREFTPAHRIDTAWSDEAIWCDVDPNRIKQVFWNLATNALKAMPNGGTLALAARRLEASDEIVLEFEDEGIGMDERAREGYFQPFHSSFGEGTGLGAAIVYRLVQEHGGRIALDSAPGAGTRVRIVLPRSQSGAPRTSSSDREPVLRAAEGASL